MDWGCISSWNKQYVELLYLSPYTRKMIWELSGDHSVGLLNIRLCMAFKVDNAGKEGYDGAT